MAAESERWKLKWAAVAMSDRPVTAAETMEKCDALLFPHMSILLQLFPTLSLTSNTEERSFSTMRRLKSYLEYHGWITPEWSQMRINLYLPIDPEKKVIDERRRNVGWTLYCDRLSTIILYIWYAITVVMGYCYIKPSVCNLLMFAYKWTRCTFIQMFENCAFPEMRSWLRHCLEVDWEACKWRLGVLVRNLRTMRVVWYIGLMFLRAHPHNCPA